MPHDSLNRKYIFLLTVAAAIILVAGTILKPKKKAEARPVASESALARLQRISERGELRELADYFSERIAASAPHTLYIPEVKATGLVWNASGTIVTTAADGELPESAIAAGPDISIVALQGSPDGSLRPPTRIPSGRLANGDWIFIVARRPDGELISRTGLFGGQTSATCGEFQYQELGSNVPLNAGLAGGGVFDLEGRLLGMVVRCADRYTAFSVDDIARALSMGGSLEGRLRWRYGLRVYPVAGPG